MFVSLTPSYHNKVVRSFIQSIIDGELTQELFAPVVQRENPLAPILPFRVTAAGFEALIFDGPEVGDLLPWLGCTVTGTVTVAASQEPSGHALGRPVPACFVHQANDGLFFGPALLYGDIGEVGGSVASPAVDEGDAETMHAEHPVHGVGAWLEGPEEGQ